MIPVFLDTDANKNLILTQTNEDGIPQRIILTEQQTNAMVDMLLGPKRVKNITVDLNKISTVSKGNPA